MKITGTTKNKREIDRYITSQKKVEPVIVNHVPYIVVSVDFMRLPNGQYSYEVLLQGIAK